MRQPWIVGLVMVCLPLATVIVLASGRRAGTIVRSGGLANLSFLLHTTRLSPSDLELGGELRGLTPGTPRYLTRDDLLTLPQVTYTVTDDGNFPGPTKVSGVPLEDLLGRLSANPKSDMVIALCSDQYRAHYPRAYLFAHHPVLVLNVNGQAPSAWPTDPEGHAMGPYLISHSKFTPSFKILSHADEAQIPWGVVRLEFRDERAVFGAIVPRGDHAESAAVVAGFRIAQQNCFRCHNQGREGGRKSGIPWETLAAIAAASPQYFAAYVRNPQAEDAHAKMPGNPGYDDGSLRALTAYFQTFSP